MPDRSTSTTQNKLAIALAVRAAMRAHRKGKPIAFTSPQRPLDKSIETEPA